MYFYPWLSGNQNQNLTETSLESMDDKSIAVLPFSTITKDSTSQYIAEGVREAILNNLFKVHKLQVGSRTSSETYRNSPKKIPEIAAELGVATILEGSAQKFGDQIRITVQLIDGKTDNHLWSEEYDRDWGDIFTIYSEIAEKVAGALQVALTPEEKQLIANTPISNVTAYDYVLQAREEQMKYWFDDDTIALKKAESLYHQALAIDPSYAPGWVRLGSIYWDRHNYSDVYTEDYFKKNYLDSVLWYCDKAIAIDPQSYSANSLKGMVFHLRGNIDLAIENYENALELVSNDDFGMAWSTSWRLGYIYIFKKDIVKGISLIRKAVQEAKVSPQDYRHMIRRLGWAYTFIGAYEEAKNYFTTEMSLGGNNFEFCRAAAYQRNIKVAIDCSITRCQTDSLYYECNYYQANNFLQLREFETSLEYFQKVRDENEELARGKYFNLYREGFALIQMGYQEKGWEITEEALSQLEIRKGLKRSDGYDYHFAAIYASRGDKERALQHLWDYRDNVIFLPPNANLIPISFSQHDIMFENLWENKEFQEFVRRDKEEKAVVIAQLKEMEELDL